MRFIGLVLVLVGLAAAYFLAYQGLTVNQTRARLSKLLSLPGLAAPKAAGTTPPAAGAAA